jgi:hypothetical protein
LIGGVPYAVFATVGLIYLWSRSFDEYMRWSVRAPVVFIPFLAAFLAWGEILGRVRSVFDFAVLLLLTAIMVLVVGYAYVGVFYAGVRALSHRATRSVAADVESV